MSAPSSASVAALAASALFASACAVVPLETPEGAEDLPPAGYGTLRQDEITVAMTVGDLQIKVTPLDESIVRLTAPDTYQRLHGIATANRPRALAESGATRLHLFLVSFFSDAEGTAFRPEEIHIVSRGVRLRPAVIVPITPGWGQRRLEQRETEVAVYGFPGPVDFNSDLTVAYGSLESNAWNGILRRILAERARVRARAGSSPRGGQASIPYLEILR
ncbi:MAG: hypothetical protein ACE5GJ_01960 [Gemmatimonadota bacterium]